MKNMKVSAKLITGFLIVIILLTIVGAVGIFGMASLDSASAELYEKQTQPFPHIAWSLTYLQEIRVELRNAILRTGFVPRVTEVINFVGEREGFFVSNMLGYVDMVDDELSLRLVGDSLEIFHSEFMPGVNAILSGALAGTNQDILIELLLDTGPAARAIVANLEQIMGIKVDMASDVNAANNALYVTLLIIIIIIIAVALAVALYLAFYVSGLIAKPLVKMGNALEQLGKTGDTELPHELTAALQECSKRKDEIGQCAEAVSKLIDHLLTIESELKSFAAGDLTADIHVLSERDTIGVAVSTMSSNLSKMLLEMRDASSHVSEGAKQVADGAQALAQGATEQAATVQELSSSISEIATMTKENAEVAEKAAELANSIMGSAEKGSYQMDQMIQAVKDINEASTSIGKIIKTIDDIAFQTNILALNAAVEAARAGQHGKGFAVVAEEVRNLAAKSAEAAKETGMMIQNSMEKAELGVQIAGGTAESLQEIVAGISESSHLMEQIATASEQQSEGIEQINTGIDQVAQVVQQNAATAEESAATSEEMSSSSTMLQELAMRFKIKGSDLEKSLPGKKTPGSFEGFHNSPAKPVYTPARPQTPTSSNPSPGRSNPAAPRPAPPRPAAPTPGPAPKQPSPNPPAHGTTMPTLDDDSASNFVGDFGKY